jgi:hypothetical protein
MCKSYISVQTILDPKSSLLLLGEIFVNTTEVRYSAKKYSIKLHHLPVYILSGCMIKLYHLSVFFLAVINIR